MFNRNKGGDQMQPFLIHNHTEMSNFRLSDSTIKVEDLLESSLELGLDGICITDHEALSSHIRAFRHIEKHKDRFKDFKLGFGNEIYLVDRSDVEYARENNTRTKYYHFILLAKNENGYKGIRELSKIAWSNAFYHRGMQRVPLYYDQLEDVMKKYKGDIIGSSACLGSYLSQSLLQSRGIKDDFREDDFTPEEIESARKGSNAFIRKMIDIFGQNDFYVELQPAARDIQQQANDLLYGIAKHYNLKPIVTTDTHYLYEDDFYKHEIYLKAQDGQREVADFYKTTYLMNKDKLLEFFDSELLDELITNTREIRDKVEPIEFGRSTQIPKAHIPEFTETAFFDSYRDKYKYIDKMLNSHEEVDRFYMYLLAEGYKEKGFTLEDEDRIERIDLELEQIWLLSEYFQQPMSGYFVFTKEIIDLIWEISIVAPNRGSAACYLTNYLLGIVQIDPMEHNLPYWRFLHVARGEEMPDKSYCLGSSEYEAVA